MEVQQRQKALDLDGGEAAFSERMNDIELAMDRLGNACCAELSLLLRLIFSYTHGGSEKGGVYRRSLNQLATKRNLCCGRKKAAQVVETAERWGLVTVVRSRRPDGAPLMNEYSICWQGVRHVRMNGTPWCPTDTRWCPGDTRCAPTDTRWCPGDTLLKEEQSSCNPLAINKKPVPVPERPAPPTDPVVELGEESEADGYTSLPKTRADQLRDQLLGTVPELIASAGTELEPLAPEQLLYGAIKAIETRHVSQPVLLARWFRMQLGLAQPVLHGTEADALLVVAAGIYAQRLPENQVRINRVAVFVNLITHRKWWNACPYVTEARRLIDGMINRHGPEWIGRKIPSGVLS